MIERCGGNIQDVTHDRIFGGATARKTTLQFLIELPDSNRSDQIVVQGGDKTSHGSAGEMLSAAE